LIGHAKILSSNELEVDDHTKVLAQRIVIAAGSQLEVPGDRFTPVSDPVINDQVGKVLASELTLTSNTAVESVVRTGNGVKITYKEKGMLISSELDYLLTATGRRSNLDSLNLQAAGITLDERRIPQFNLATGKTKNSTLFIAGDVSNTHPLLH